MGVITYGKFVFAGEELILDEYELVQLLKMCKKRNRKLWKKFANFYSLVISDESKALFKEVDDE